MENMINYNGAVATKQKLIVKSQTISIGFN